MTTFFHSFIALTLVWGIAAQANPDIIYGEDNRLDTFESPSGLFQKLAQSTAAQVPRTNIKIVGSGAELHGPELKDIFRLCQKERFRHQPFIANCSGFLVAPDIIATAGHCFETRDKCTQYDWVFNYKVSSSHQTSVTVDKSDVYKCKEVIKQSLTDSTDFALIRLDRPVVGVVPVKIADKAPAVGTPVVMIGHPSGLPQKITDQAEVRSVTKTEFKANLDAFQINSGSAVFNAKSGELLGILVRGQMDYRTNTELSCTEVNTTLDEKSGEDISLYTQFLPFLKN